MYVQQSYVIAYWINRTSINLRPLINLLQPGFRVLSIEVYFKLFDEKSLNNKYLKNHEYVLSRFYLQILFRKYKFYVGNIYIYMKINDAFFYLVRTHFYLIKSKNPLKFSSE